MKEGRGRKHVCITGCTRGLGRAMAAMFAAAEWTVSGCGRSGRRIEALSEVVRDEAPHLFRPVDVTDDGQVEHFCKEVVEAFGAPDLLLNNAATINANAPLWLVPAEEFSQVIDVNLKGVASVIRHFVPAMIYRGTGVIVNFSSGWGRSTAPEVAPYCATKWGIEGLTQALAQELPDGLAAVALNPGVIDTDMLRSCWGEGAASCPGPEEWAQTGVPFLMELGVGDNGKSLTAT